MRIWRHVLDESPHWLLVLVAFALPLLYLPFTVDVLELNKQTLLVWAAVLATLLWAAGFVERKEGRVRWHWTLLFPIAFVLATIVSAFASIGGFVSWVGTSLQEYQSVLTVVSLFLLFFVLLQTTHEEKHERHFFAALLFSGLIALVVFFANATQATFNTVGTINALALFGIVISILGQALFLVHGRGEREGFYSGWFGWIEKFTVIAVSALTLVLLLALDFWALWVVVIAGLLPVFAFGIARAAEFPQTRRFLLSMAFMVCAIFFLFLPRPFNLGLPVEVTPSLKASVQMMKDTWGAHTPWLGSGPGTYVYDYTRFHAADVNQTAFWNARFDRGFSYLLTLAATGGVASLALFLLFAAIVKLAGLNRLLRVREHREWKMSFVLMSAWGAVATSGFLYHWNLTMLWMFFLLSALVLAEGIAPRHLSFSASPRGRLAVSFVLVMCSVGVLSILFMTVSRYKAEVAFARALRADRAVATAQEVSAYLLEASTANRYNDVVHRNLAEALLWQAQEVLKEKGDAGAEEAARLAAGSINAAKRATELAPFSVQNWLTRGQVYRELVGVTSQADEFGRLSFERAIELDPTSPIPQTELARLFLVEAQQAQDAKGKELALSEAEKALDAALGKKADYASAHYYLAILYGEQGKAKEALQKMKDVARANPRDIGVLFQLGVLALGQKDHALAEGSLARALELVPTYANARWFLASVYEEQGEEEKAIAELKRLQETDPNNPIVNARVERLQKSLAAPATEPLSELPEAASTQP